MKKKKKSNEGIVSIGPRKLTRFEKAKVISARALQIAMGAPVLINIPESEDSPIEIALLELKEGILPISNTSRPKWQNEATFRNNYFLISVHPVIL